MTTANIFELYNKGQEQKAKLQQEITALQSKQADAVQAAEEAAGRGDTDTYITERDRAERISAEIYVRQTQLTKADNPVTLEQAQAAWTETAKPLNKQIERAEREYKQARADLAKKFKELIKLNEQSKQARDDLAQLICPDQIGRGRINETFPAVRTAYSDLHNDREYFVRLALITPAEGQQAAMALSNPAAY